MSTELLVLGGERVPAAEEKTFDVIEPATGAPMARAARIASSPRTCRVYAP